MPSPGRNDPCHCGSGKKYKHCHFAADRAAAGQRADADRSRLERLEAVGHPSDNEIRELYHELTGRSLQAGPIPDQARETVTDVWRQRRLADRALVALAPERKQWEAYFRDRSEEFDAVAAELGRDPFFDRFVLTNANAHKVRRRLGEPPREDPAARRAYAAEAVGLSLDDEDRANFRQALLGRVPELIDAGRLREAYVMAVCAERAEDPKAPVSPFLEDVVMRSLRR